MVIGRTEDFTGRPAEPAGFKTFFILSGFLHKGNNQEIERHLHFQVPFLHQVLMKTKNKNRNIKQTNKLTNAKPKVSVLLYNKRQRDWIFVAFLKRCPTVGTTAVIVASVHRFFCISCLEQKGRCCVIVHSWMRRRSEPMHDAARRNAPTKYCRIDDDEDYDPRDSKFVTFGPCFCKGMFFGIV